MAHSYVSDPPILPGALVTDRLAPIRFDMDVTAEQTVDFDTVVQTPDKNSILGCRLLYTRVYFYGTALFQGGVDLAVPAEVDGKPVVAVAMHVHIELPWERFATGGPGDRDVDGNCSAQASPAIPPGDSTWVFTVDGAEVYRVHGVGEPFGDPGGGFDGTLALPPAVFETGGAWFLDLDLFALPPPLQLGSASDLFWGPFVPGQSFPERFEISALHENVRWDYLNVPGVMIPQPVGPHPTSVINTDEFDCWVDLYPFTPREVAVEPGVITAALGPYGVRPKKRVVGRQGPAARFV